jgi:hypothetical protein
MSKYIPVHEYAKLKNTSIQNVYRWIRERKIKEEDVRRETVEVTRIRIKENA